MTAQPIEPNQPPTKRAQADAKRASKKITEDLAIRRAGARRKRYEMANPERHQGIEVLPGHVSHKQSYRDMDIGVAHEAGENTPGQMQFEGMGHPAAVNNPPRWEELSKKQQTRISRNAAKFGVTHESAVRALGAQVDQAALHEGRLGQRHASFYAAEGRQPSGDMTPRTRIKTSARENAVPFEQQAVANSITSPKTKFAVTPKSGPNEGMRVYPNDMHASEAIHYAKEGRPEEARAAAGVGGMHTNVKKASRAIVKMQAGATASEAWKAGPKTGPYHNSWVDPHGPDQYWVSDIHSGGGGIAPHLSVTEREKFLGIEGIHAFNDRAARTVAEQRGIKSLTGMQSMQWNEERDLRHQQNSRYGERTEQFAGARGTKDDHEMHGQTDIFGGTYHVVHPTVSAGPKTNEMTEKDYQAGQAISRARTSKRSKERLESLRPEAKATLDTYLKTGKASAEPMHIPPIKNTW